MNKKTITIRFAFVILIFSIFIYGFSIHVWAKEMYIVLDPGHGGEQSGAEITKDGEKIYEKDINLKIALALKEELLTYKDVSVSLTREADKKMELEERFQLAVDEQADLFVSLHNNAKGDIYDFDNGCTVLVSKGQYKSELAEEEQKLGCNILFELSSIGIANRGLLLRTSQVGDCYPNGELADYYGLIRASVLNNIPGIIVEHAFLDNEDDYNHFLSTDESLTKLAVADARGIARYYGLKKSDSDDVLSPLNNVKEELLWIKDENAEHNESTWKLFYESEKTTTALTTEETPVKKSETDISVKSTVILEKTEPEKINSSETDTGKSMRFEKWKRLLVWTGIALIVVGFLLLFALIFWRKKRKNHEYNK